jgi:hypothetical protein
MEKEEVVIKGLDDGRVFVDEFDDDIWLSIQVRMGGARCILKRDQVKLLVEELQKLLDVNL